MVHEEPVDRDEFIKLVQDEAMKLPDWNVAVSGISGRFPKSDSVNEFEENLRQGKDMINDQDNSRFTCGLWGLPPRAGRLKDLSRFDSEFFGYTNFEANYIDYQLRILYEVVYESIIDAGINPASLRGTNTGVFFGFHCNEFENVMVDDPAFKSNGYYGQFATKVSQYFDLRGITVTFDAACASGFVGLHNAIEAIKMGSCDRAIVCSSNIPIHPTGSFIFLQMQMLSPTGYSRFLDSRADGYVKSESCVSILLQRKDIAERNYATILGSMTSVDGYKKEGITFPSYKSQEELIRATKNLVGLSTNNVEYLEAHGTGTPAGDPQEARAITNVYCALVEGKTPKESEAVKGGAEGEKQVIKFEVIEGDVKTETVLESEEVLSDGSDARTIGPLLVGSVKTNMGHSEAASGLCAMTKVALMLENELIYGGLHYENPNSNIASLTDGRLKFSQGTKPLTGKVIPMSCYGFGGANVHVVLRASEQPSIDQSKTQAIIDDSVEDLRLIVMFGRTEQALNSFFDRLINAEGSYNYRNCLSNDFLHLVDSINAGKIDRLMNHRGFLIVNRNSQGIRGGQEVVRHIERCELPFDSSKRHIQDGQPPQCNVILAGLGCQWPKMASGLISCKQFWSTIERLAKILEPFEPDVQLIGTLIDDPKEIHNTMTNRFCAIVAYEIALINMVKNQLKCDGIKSIIGHSLGEISAAYAAGLFDEREAIVVAFRIGQTLDLNRDSIAGKMVAIGMTESEALSLISGYKTAQVSCVNGLESVTISGSHREMDEVCLKLKNDGMHFFKVVEDSVALHNEIIMTSHIRQKLKDSLLKVLHPLSTFDRSNTSWISSSVEAIDNYSAGAEYFAAAMCRKVDFLKAIQKMTDNSIAIELSPAGLFESQLRFMNLKDFHYIKAMKQDTPETEQVITLLKALGYLYTNGVTFNLDHFYHPKVGEQTRFQVRRQTPSLSSLIKWDHRQEYFVPRYPMQFSKSSAKCELPVEVLHDRDKYLLGHCIEGRCLFPATGYLFIIWRIFSFTKRRIYDSCFQDVENELVPVEFLNVRLLRAVILGNRTVQFYLHYEEASGRFEVKEGGSVVVEGYARTPVEKPNGLLYDGVRDLIKARNPRPELQQADIYKQFRVSGYDYGETFQCIEEASDDGSYSKVKFNGHFVSLTDSILQSIFLAVTHYAPSGGLFLPTRFDYVRFQPEIILAKMRAANMKFDQLDGSLSTTSKREIMTKIMERESGKAATNEETKNREENEKNTQVIDEEKPKCIFEAYCDPITGIIVSDGIEMRGIKASPAPRRVDNNEVLLESYQFTSDYEDPIQDHVLTDFYSTNAEYTKVCDSMSINLLKNLCEKRSRHLKEIEVMIEENGLLSQNQIDTYKKRNLTCLADEDPKPEGDGEEGKSSETYDIKKNGDKMLLSILDQLLNEKSSSLYEDQKRISNLVKENRVPLMNDLIQSSHMTERLMRPIIETVIENICQRKMKLKLLELNTDDGIVQDPLNRLMKAIEPTLSIDYSLAHPDISRLNSEKILTASSNDVKTHTMKDIQSLFIDRTLKDMDLVIYKDISCYSLPKRVIEKNGLAPVMDSLREGVRPGGFLILIMRQKLTLAERVLLALSEPELVGLSRRDLDHLIEKGSDSSAVAKVNGINSILTARCELMLKEANRNQLVCVSRKSDPNGCLVMLFKNLNTKQRDNSDIEANPAEDLVPVEKMLIRVSHENEREVQDWMARLKENFKSQEAPESDKTEESNAIATANEGLAKKQPKEVWLCAVATKQRPINGLIGMMQALRKELGSTYLRCYYDQFTFKESNEPITEAQIEECKNFRMARERNMIWNCINESGEIGAFRHFTINDYLSYSNCSCSKQPVNEIIEIHNRETKVPTPAYVNNAARGDLSSFTWYEAPFKYLNEEQRKNLVTISYSALNFRDIMLATGRLPLDAIPVRLAMCDCLLGLEFSGYDYKNRRVMGMVFGRGIASVVECPELSSIKMEIPEGLDMKEAATIPVVYATAIMALIYRGNMKAGESILIHAGSGGVGQAAIRLALYFGLEVFTTVGTEEKRAFLLEEFGKEEGNYLKDDHIFSSRDCTFEEKILRATSGRGVDLVLNSLADDKLQASVRSLANGGRFLEIGKYDMSTDARLELLALDHNKTFHGILLDKLFDTDDIGISFRKQLKSVVDTMKDGLAKGYIKPIKYTMFRRDQIEEAFRFMATGKHIGKILIEINGASESSIVQAPNLKCIPRFQLSPEKSYVVTGGLGGFGLELTKWLVNQGARHILITSRSGIKTGYQKVTLSRLERNDARFSIVTHDTTTRDGVKKLLDSAVNMSPVKSIGAVFHLAMILKDTLLENMKVEDFAQVCAPKVATCEHLDSVLNDELKDQQLDYFVAFSSVTSGKGNAGQANYAYANSCIERICEKRRLRGQHGLAIQWGAIGDVGVAFENLGGNNVVVGGTIPQRMPSCQATLSRLLCSPFSVCLSVLPVNRGEGASGVKGDLVGAIFHVLGIKDPSKVSDSATLGDLGLDSLMAVEIRQYIEREYDMTLNMQEIRGLTIGKIREIGENGPSKKVTLSGSQDGGAQIEGPKIVENYGRLASIENGLPKAVQNEAIQKILDKNFIGSFKPELKLPSKKYRPLNHLTKPKLNGFSNVLSLESQKFSNGPLTSNGSNDLNNSCKAKPIFFIPPIHGSFKQLEVICQHVNRPCIGLNWNRRLGKAASIPEAVDYYLEHLEDFDWSPYEDDTSDENKQGRKIHVVDLVGYSYGATIAFELMLALHKKKRKLNGSSRLIPGRLVLLDGSPRQIEMGAQVLSSLQNRQLKLSEKLDEFLMIYILSHTRHLLSSNLLEFQDELSKTEIEDKIPFASKKLCELLGLSDNAEIGLNGHSNGVENVETDGSSDSSGEDEEELNIQTQIEHAMEAFCRRYDTIDKYKLTNNLPGNCTLIRAEKIYFKGGDEKYQDDLDLSSAVSGNVDLHILPGDHESFLIDNSTSVAKIIESQPNGSWK